MPTSTNRQQHETWLLELTSIPTAAGCEQRVVRWIETWVKKRSKRMSLDRDRFGNLLLHSRAGAKGRDPLYITAHLDHPAFVVRDVIDDRTVELEFRGGVHTPYFEQARIEILDRRDEPRRATIEAIDADAKPFKRVRAHTSRGATRGLAAGDVGRWLLPKPRIAAARGRADAMQAKRLLFTHACDDLAAVAAALAAFDELAGRDGFGHVGLLFTLAEEVGFIGAIAAARGGSVPHSSRLVCLENSRSFAESPIAAGPILRVGDRLTVFSPELTNRLGHIYSEHQKQNPSFAFQRKLMAGGACEASAFAEYGYASTCLCLPLGNYHNMTDIDGVLAGSRPAKVGPEFISVEDFHGLVGMLLVTAEQLDSATVAPFRDRLESLYADHRGLLSPSRELEGSMT